MIEKLRHLVEAGFAIVLLRPRSKMPADNEWSTAPVLTFEKLRKRYQRGQNVGVRLGKWSRIDGLYLHVFDVDIKDEKYKDEALDSLDELLRYVDWRKLPRVKSGSGGPSFHIYFLSKSHFSSKTVAKSSKKFTDSKGKSHRFWEIELFGTGKQVAIPPSIHPDTGNAYKWLIEPNFDAGIPVICKHGSPTAMAKPRVKLHG